MRCYQTFPLAVMIALIGSPAVAQEYWEYEPWEGETELHRPTEGLEYEYEDDGDINVEREGYEWEAGEGYHEEEWYDPSDWFDDDSTVDYEYDDGDYGYDTYDYGYDTYDYGYDDYDDYDYDYDYAYGYDDVYDDDENVNYEFNQQVTGRIEGLQRFRGAEGAPRSVRLKLKTDDGKTRTLHLGDLAYVNRYFPKLSKGDEIVVGGEMVQENGRQIFQAKEVQSANESYLIPGYQYDRRVEGQLKGLRKVRMKDSDVELVVARIQTDDGKTMNVRLGRPDEMPGISRTMRPGAKVRAEGYKREVDGKSTFVVQDFKVLQRSEKSDQEGERQQMTTRENRSRS